MMTMQANAGEYNIITEQELHTENEDAISVLIQDSELCHMDKNTCETNLQSALNKAPDLSWYQEPTAIVGIAAGSTILGVIFHSLFVK